MPATTRTELDRARRVKRTTNLGFSLGDVDVVIDVLAAAALDPQTALADAVTVRLEQLVEDVVRSLHLLLLGDARLLQEVGHDVTPGQFTRGREKNTDELSKPRGIVIPGRLGVTIRLQNWIGGNNLVLE